MDFITDLLPSRNNKAIYNAILVIVDRFSKNVPIIPAQKTWRAGKHFQNDAGSDRQNDWQNDWQNSLANIYGHMTGHVT
jgi:hypothetical protein